MQVGLDLIDEIILLYIIYNIFIIHTYYKCTDRETEINSKNLCLADSQETL